ncbi:MAG: hypothetical protein IJN66_08350 [Muribaculaceae bacterium]|nr:hypothetical protein [Muribaculaceae bacterium]
MKLTRNTKILLIATIIAFSSCTPLDSVIIDTGYYDPFYYGPGMPPPPIVNPLPPAPPGGHKPAPPKPDHKPGNNIKPDHKPDNKPNKPNKPGNNIKPDHKPNNTPTINPGNNGHRPSGNQPGKRPSNSRRH